MNQARLGSLLNTAKVLAMAAALSRCLVFTATADDSACCEIEWESDRSAVSVVGLPETSIAWLGATDRANKELSSVLSVFAEQGNILADIGVPPMLGDYSVESNTLVFSPTFPLSPGVSYRAVFNPNELPANSALPSTVITAKITSSPQVRVPSTIVTGISPSARTLPENLLKFYIHFSAPMSRGRIYDHIHLVREDGREIELPFLEIDEELWDAGMTRLTLFIDPGRIKRGVHPLEEIGPALEEGHSYQLRIDSNWKDANGARLKQSYVSNFQVGAPDRTPIDPEQWRISPPKSGTRDALRIDFGESLDHALAGRMIHVLHGGNITEGTVSLTLYDSAWEFTPESRWLPGDYKLAIEKTLEDLSGNNVGKPFDVDLFEGVKRRETSATTTLTFHVSSGD